MRQDIYCNRNNEKRKEGVDSFFHSKIGGVFVSLSKS